MTGTEYFIITVCPYWGNIIIISEKNKKVVARNYISSSSIKVFEMYLKI